MGHPPRPSSHRFPPLPPNISPRYPRFKAWKDAKWRSQLQASRETSSEPSSKEINMGPKERLEVDNYPHGDEEARGSDLETLEEENSSDHSVGLAEVIASMTEKQLGIDVLDQGKDISTFLSYLLDTIQIMENHAQYRDAKSSSSGSGSDSGSDSQDEEAVINQPVPFKVVHRVFCTAMHHTCHGTQLYEDEPVNRSVQYSPGSSMLQGEKKIFNLDTWLSERPSLCFIIIKEHLCNQYQRPRNRNYDLDEDVKLPSARLERLRIVSPVLQKALKQVAKFQIYPKYRHEDFVAEMEAPYSFLFHHRKQLAELAGTGVVQEVISHLMSFLEEHYEAEYREAEEMFLQGCVNAHHIHKLFKPNQMLLSSKKGEPIFAFILGRYSQPKREEILLHGWKWHYNGHDLQRASEHARIGLVPEEKTRICDLETYPAEFAREEAVKMLTERGNKFWSMRNQSFICYTGWDRESKHQYASARFMVDTATYRIMHGHSAPSAGPPPQHDPWPVRVNRREDMPQKTEMLLPATVHGFNLKEKKWVKLYVENTHAVDWNYRAFDRLVLDVKIKEMIRALVDVQTSAKGMDDIITGKGNGLIILLHGSPGTGKTLTAESVAEIAEKPLYRVTCGDIGTDARDVERYLETVMYLGKTWDCVLLLDEADVFLEERTMADLQRNSLVSVFLRLLEYYEGILILTSNRVGTFDEAFKSRIQVAIRYDNLNTKSRKAIWQNFFDMIKETAEDDANMPELERRLDHLAKEEMNGRQIRNALLTARQLAKHRKEPLDWEHLSQVIETSAAFNNLGIDGQSLNDQNLQTSKIALGRQQGCDEKPSVAHQASDLKDLDTESSPRVPF
ncbi:hypothetical protein CSIM01_03807 [Colletotrichum simmondsii]|uniref:AAA+ ATPase domain-containing protein n=1 Tax=Colletotrichum simmondsii TaxID=703756 RepID=A0A135TN14_9PEZI|nr:hypothetical protein CSIM01_03807 [Colletotrichum simmondsii]